LNLLNVSQLSESSMEKHRIVTERGRGNFATAMDFFFVHMLKGP